MSTIQVTIPATIELAIKHNGNQTVDLSNMSPDWFAWAIGNGIRQSAGDADAGLGEESTATRAAAVMAKFQRIAEGHIPAGGSGGARLSYTDKAWRVVLKARLMRAGWKATEAAKLAMDREKALEELFAKLLAMKYGQKPDRELVADAITRNLPTFKRDVDAEAEAIEAADRRKAELAKGTGALDFDSLGIDL